jgi:hypothetical protein
MTWLSVGIIAAAGVYVAHPIGVWDKVMGIGGLTLSSLVRSTWETMICVGLSVGLIVLFREVFHRSHWLLVAMAAASFAAYILHLAIVIAAQAAIEGLALPAIIKFALVAVSATILAFGLAHLSSAGRPRTNRAVATSATCCVTLPIIAAPAGAALRFLRTQTRASVTGLYAPLQQIGVSRGGRTNGACKQRAAKVAWTSYHAGV